MPIHKKGELTVSQCFPDVDRVRDRARAEAQRQDEQDRVRQRLRSAGRR